MRKTLASVVAPLVIAVSWSGIVLPQSSTGTISGTISDQNGAVITGANITARNIATGLTRVSNSDEEGRYRFSSLPTGTYQLTVESPSFRKFVRTDITVDVGQEAKVVVALEPGPVDATVQVSQNASILDTSTSEVSTRFDHRRISEVPIATNRNLFNIVLSAPGITQRVTGQTAFALGGSFSSNGGRIRSNNFELDGQDLNDPALGGSQMALNNPDAIEEVRIITNQFLPEHGHNAGSVIQIVSRKGANDLHGTAFWFHNNENFNACSNTDKRAGFCNPNALDDARSKAPYRRENQFGFTIGGPLFFPRFGEGGPDFYKGKDKTFFFADYQRWSDRRTPSFTIRGAPTAEGRTALMDHAGNRPQVQQLLRFVPAGMPSGRRPISVNFDGQSFNVGIGDLTSSANFKFDCDQGSFRIDHTPDNKNVIFARYRYSYEATREAAQINPPGHGTIVDLGVNAVAVGWTYTRSSNVINEARLGWKRLRLSRDAEDPVSYSIPAIEILELGMIGVPETETRTAFGIATNLPVFRTSSTFQIADSVTVIKGKHALKFGGEFRRTTETSALFSIGRGSLAYAKLDDFVNDRALQSSFKGFPVAGSDVTQRYKWYEAYFYAQDQWNIRPNLTLLYGVRYEYPGDSFEYLREVNERILAANNNDPEYRFEPSPKPDLNNWMPRVGFTWNPKTSGKGIFGFLTGGDRLVLRGGYARSYDPWILNINQNIYTASFPFTSIQTFASYDALVRATAPTNGLRQRARIVPASDFRSPATDQISFDVQRELFTDYVLRVGYIRTRGIGLFQNVQGNPFEPCVFGSGEHQCNITGIDRVTGRPASAMRPDRVDSSRDIVSIRANSAASTYDALQVSLEKRLSRGFSFGVHYTRSSLIDTASDVFSPSALEAGLSQDPFDWNGDRGPGSYDRPHRLTGNFVYELPFYSKQRGIVGKLLGGWQINSFFNFQSGAAFSPLLGLDPTGANNPLRSNLFTNLDVSKMSVAQLYQLERQLRAQAEAVARRNFNPSSPCGWLTVQLPVTLFTAPRGRVDCDTTRRRELVMEYPGILEGQRVGNAGRNILRADGLRLVDFGVVKNTRITDRVRVQFWTDFFNAFNERNFGIPNGIINAVDFLDQWSTDGGSRRIRLGARLVF